MVAQCTWCRKLVTVRGPQTFFWSDWVRSKNRIEGPTHMGNSVEFWNGSDPNVCRWKHSKTEEKLLQAQLRLTPTIMRHGPTSVRLNWWELTPKRTASNCLCACTSIAMKVNLATDHQCSSIPRHTTPSPLKQTNECGSHCTWDHNLFFDTLIALMFAHGTTAALACSGSINVGAARFRRDLQSSIPMMTIFFLQA